MNTSTEILHPSSKSRNERIFFFGQEQLLRQKKKEDAKKVHYFFSSLLPLIFVVFMSQTSEESLKKTFRLDGRLTSLENLKQWILKLHSVPDFIA